MNIVFNCLLYSTAVVDCSHPPRLTNATVAFNETTFGQAAQYICDKGHWFRRDERQTFTWCTDKGNWTDTRDTCEGMFHWAQNRIG